MNYLKLNYSFQKHWRELLSFAFAILSALVAFVFSTQPGLIFGISILLTTLLSTLTLYFLFREKDFYYLALDNYNDQENWFGSGEFKFDKTNNAYLIANTDAGFIFSQCLNWKDYLLEGEFKILNRNLGVIVRATNTSNYVMLQITKNSVRPHIRANGGWLPVYEVNKTGLSFEKEIKDGKWYKFSFTIKGERAEIKIYDKNEYLINKDWQFIRGNIAVQIFKKGQRDNDSSTHELDISVSYDYGSIGFRSSHGESALVRNLLIRAINSKS